MRFSRWNLGIRFHVFPSCKKVGFFWGKFLVLWNERVPLLGKILVLRNERLLFVGENICQIQAEGHF
jgi:hypothetical protein